MKCQTSLLILFCAVMAYGQTSPTVQPTAGVASPMQGMRTVGAVQGDVSNSAANSYRQDYTAQQRPRVTVAVFEDTNRDAVDKAYGRSVSGMLQTFLKKKSQMTLVDRQNVQQVVEEWKKQDTGVAQPTGESGPPLLMNTEAIVTGKVTLLPVSHEIEIDATLISGKDGHVIAAAQERGVVECLRQTVERLGIAIEDAFLRPYYGSLKVDVQEPANVRVFLTPIAAASAPDDEKIPFELDRTAKQHSQEQWITSPVHYTINNLLRGWYTIRLSRPGFDEIRTDNRKLTAVSEGPGSIRILQSSTAEPAPEQKKYLVEIRALETAKWAGVEHGISKLVKQGGSLQIRVQREFLDRSFAMPAELRNRDGSPAVVRTLLMDAREQGRSLLEINRQDDLAGSDRDDSSDDTDAKKTCKRETQTHPPLVDRAADCERRQWDRTVWEQFQGGNLRIEDYHKADDEGRMLPVGNYTLIVASPGYEPREVKLELNNRELDVPIDIKLVRVRGHLELKKPQGVVDSSHYAVIEGIETNQKYKVALDFQGTKSLENVPLDTYRVSTDLPGFKGWSEKVLFEAAKAVRVLDSGDNNQCLATLSTSDALDGSKTTPSYTVDLKLQPWVFGRTELSQFHDPLLAVQSKYSLNTILDFAERQQKKSTDAKKQSEGLLVTPKASSDGYPEGIAQFFGDYLKSIDLLYLDDNDTQRLAALPAMAAAIHTYIEAGGAVFAFVKNPADYSVLFGATLPIKPQFAEYHQFELRQGDVPEVSYDIRVKFRNGRQFPVLQTDDKGGLSGWKIVAFRLTRRSEPCIVERSGNGYVLVWLDSPASVMKVDSGREVMEDMEKRAIAWAQYLMYRRLDATSSEVQTAESKLKGLTASRKGDRKLDENM